MTRTRDENPVRLRREELGMRLIDLAGALNRNAAFVSNMEGGFVPSAARRDQVAKVLGTTPELLWPEEYA
jgi:transcriptional regulator with XRE-family HTH domain